MAANLRYLDAIKDHVLIFDGAMGTSIQRFPLTAKDFGGEKLNGCNDYLVITRPDVIEQIHASFLAVGSEVIETNTFRSNRLTLAGRDILTAVGRAVRVGVRRGTAWWGTGDRRPGARGRRSKARPAGRTWER
jgi:5-methyltetrahydrofolate--homocysteine methyltransferase